jgi:hypothetical protein
MGYGIQSGASPFGNQRGVNENRPYTGNVEQQFGQELADQFQPNLSSIQALLGSILNTASLARTQTPPQDRYQNGFADAGDIQFQQTARYLVENGTIREGTFVLSDTGHDIPMMMTLMRQLDMSGGLALPNYNPAQLGNGTRVAAQAQTWGDEIAQLDERNSEDGRVDSLFLGIDAHRDKRPSTLDITRLPLAQALRNAGIDRIVYLSESSPGRKSIDSASDDVEGYLRALQESGIEVIVEGVDERQSDPNILHLRR